MATVITGLKRMRVSAATNPKNVRELLRTGVRTLAGWSLVKRHMVSATGGLRRRVRRVIATGRGRHRTGHPAAHPARIPVPPPMPVAVESSAPSVPSSVVYEDPPPLVLPRIPAAERFPIVWDPDPVGLYIVRYERERVWGVAR